MAAMLRCSASPDSGRRDLGQSDACDVAAGLAGAHSSIKIPASLCAPDDERTDAAVAICTCRVSDAAIVGVRFWLIPAGQ
jgi:hypothetical protein